MPINKYSKDNPNLSPIWIDSDSNVLEWIPLHQEFFKLVTEEKNEINSYMSALQEDYPILKGKECKVIFFFGNEIVLLVKKEEVEKVSTQYANQDLWLYSD